MQTEFTQMTGRSLDPIGIKGANGADASSPKVPFADVFVEADADKKRSGGNSDTTAAKAPKIEAETSRRAAASREIHAKEERNRDGNHDVRDGSEADVDPVEEVNDIDISAEVEFDATRTRDHKNSESELLMSSRGLGVADDGLPMANRMNVGHETKVAELDAQPIVHSNSIDAHRNSDGLEDLRTGGLSDPSTGEASNDQDGKYKAPGPSQYTFSASLPRPIDRWEYVTEASVVSNRIEMYGGLNPVAQSMGFFAGPKMVGDGHLALSNDLMQPAVGNPADSANPENERLPNSPGSANGNKRSNSEAIMDTLGGRGVTLASAADEGSSTDAHSRPKTVSGQELSGTSANPERLATMPAEAGPRSGSNHQGARVDASTSNANSGSSAQTHFASDRQSQAVNQPALANSSARAGWPVEIAGALSQETEARPAHRGLDDIHTQKPALHSTTSFSGASQKYGTSMGVIRSLHEAKLPTELVGQDGAETDPENRIAASVDDGFGTAGRTAEIASPIRSAPQSVAMRNAGQIHSSPGVAEYRRSDMEPVSPGRNEGVSSSRPDGIVAASVDQAGLVREHLSLETRGFSFVKSTGSDEKFERGEPRFKVPTEVAAPRSFTPQSAGTPAVSMNTALTELEQGKTPFASIDDGIVSESLIDPRGLGSVGTVRDAAMTSPFSAQFQSPYAQARDIAQQMSVAIRQSSREVTELVLSPEELGNVKMRIAAQDGQIVLSIFAERNETQDLMRRHIDLVERAFRDLGYDDVSFEFANSDSSHKGCDDAESDRLEREEDSNIAGEDIKAASPRTTSASRLDIRL